MNQLNSFMQIQTAWCCASWRPTTRTTWRCRSTSRCCSRSAATAASLSCECPAFRGCSSCWHQWTPTETRRSSGTFTACWSRTPRRTTAGYKRWAPTARRADAWTSGYRNWSCKSDEGSTGPEYAKHRQTQELFLGSDGQDRREIRQVVKSSRICLEGI